MSSLNTSRTKSRIITNGRREGERLEDGGNGTFFEDKLGDTIARGYRIIRVAIVDK